MTDLAPDSILQPGTKGPMVPAPITKQILLERHEPWLTSDLVDYLGSVSWMFGELELYSYDTADEEGWVIVYDPATCPVDALPYLAQFVGQPIPMGSSQADMRALVANKPRTARGTPQAIRDAVKPYLTGTQALVMQERYGGISDQLLVSTYTSETPDPGAVAAALRNVVPVDIRLTYSVTAGQLWSTLKANYATWNAVKAHYPTWDGVRADLAV